MNIAFCDDNKILLGRIERIVKELIDEYNIYNFKFKYYCYTDPYELLQEHREKFFDVVFLDIEMPEENGLNIGDEIFLVNENIIIFYVTSYNHFLAESLKHRVYRFVDKGDEKELRDGIKSMIKDFAERGTRYTFEYKKHRYSIPLTAIKYFESSHNDVKIVTDGEIFLQRATITELSELLPKVFCRCHAGYIVNISKVKDFDDDDLTLNNDIILPISRKYLFNFIRSFDDYMKTQEPIRSAGWTKKIDDKK